MNKSEEYDPTEEEMRSLLKEAGSRPAIDQRALAEIKNVAHRVWRERYVEKTANPQGRQWAWPLAAALFCAMVLSWWTLHRAPTTAPPSAAAILAARVERWRGVVTSSQSNDENERTSVSAGQPLIAGSVILTDSAPGPSGAALRMVGGQSLRLHAGTRARLVSPKIVELERGALYLDSMGRGSITIRTAFGDFYPIGTQFEIRIGSEGERQAELRVREGRVRLHSKANSLTASAGEEVIVHGDGSIVRGRSRPDDPSWDWVLASVPMLDIEGRTLAEFLSWVAREKGWQVKFASPEAAAASRTIILHGSIAQQSAVEALQTVTLSSGFEYQVTDGVLLMRSK